MKKVLYLQVIPLDKTQPSLSVHCEEIRIPTLTGQLGILPHHADLMALVSKGTLYYKTLEKEANTFQVNPGIVHVKNNTITLLQS